MGSPLQVDRSRLDRLFSEGLTLEGRFERRKPPAEVTVEVTRSLFHKFRDRFCKHLILRRPLQWRRDELLLDAAVAVRAGRIEDAAKILDPYYRVLLSDAVYLNMVACIAECKGDSWTAMRLYHVCLTLDASYAPPRSNLYRCAARGNDACTPRAVDLGDTYIRAHRTLPAK